jgi:transposase
MLKQTPSAKDLLEQVYRASPEIARMAQLAQDFFRIVCKRDFLALSPWIVAAKQTVLTGFASRLERDLGAVNAALKLPWSQGHVATAA